MNGSPRQRRSRPTPSSLPFTSDGSRLNHSANSVMIREACPGVSGPPDVDANALLDRPHRALRTPRPRRSTCLNVGQPAVHLPSRIQCNRENRLKECALYWRSCRSLGRLRGAVRRRRSSLTGVRDSHGGSPPVPERSNHESGPHSPRNATVSVCPPATDGAC